MITITWKMQGGNIVVSDNHYVENAGGKYMVSDYHNYVVCDYHYVENARGNMW